MSIFEPSIPEAIETIVDCFQLRGVTTGSFGMVSSIEGLLYVTTRDRHFTVSHDGAFWNVREGDAVATARTLLDAGAMLIGADFVRHPKGVC